MDPSLSSEIEGIRNEADMKVLEAYLTHLRDNFSSATQPNRLRTLAALERILDRDPIPSEDLDVPLETVREVVDQYDPTRAREIVRKSGLSQAEIGRRIGLAPWQMTRYIQNPRLPSPDHLTTESREYPLMAWLAQHGYLERSE